MKKNVLIPLVSSLVLLVVVVIAYGFWYSTVNTESTNAGDLALKIAQQSDAASRSAQAKLELTQLGNQQATVNQYFVETNDLVPFLEQLQALGKFLGTDVQVGSVSASPGLPYGTLALSISITGTFDNVLRTLGAIEYQPFNITTSSLSLTIPTAPSGTATSSPQWTATAIFTVGAKTGGPTTIIASTTSTTTDTTASSTNL